MGGYVYIACNSNHRTLYVGVTSNLVEQMLKHREHFYANYFTQKYKCGKLVYYKWFDQIEDAFKEKERIKTTNRKKKTELINGMNKGWKDLFGEIKLR